MNVLNYNFCVYVYLFQLDLIQYSNKDQANRNPNISYYRFRITAKWCALWARQRIVKTWRSLCRLTPGTCFPHYIFLRVSKYMYGVCYLPAKDLSCLTKQQNSLILWRQEILLQVLLSVSSLLRILRLRSEATLATHERGGQSSRCGVFYFSGLVIPIPFLTLVLFSHMHFIIFISEFPQSLISYSNFKILHSFVITFLY